MRKPVVLNLRYGKTGNKKHATCLATLLQNELNSDVVHFTTPIKPVLQQIRLLTGLNVDSKTTTLLCSSVAALLQKKLHVRLDYKQLFRK